MHAYAGANLVPVTVPDILLPHLTIKHEKYGHLNKIID